MTTSSTNTEIWRDKFRYGGKAKKLTAAQVLEIRRLKADGLRIPEIAPLYQVSVETVRNIVKGVTFAWLE